MTREEFRASVREMAEELKSKTFLSDDEVSDLLQDADKYDPILADKIRAMITALRDAESYVMSTVDRS